MWVPASVLSMLLCISLLLCILYLISTENVTKNKCRSLKNMCGCRLQPMDGWGSLLQPCVGDSVCPLFLSSLMNEQQKASWGFPACSRQGWVGGWGVGGDEGGSHALILASMLSGWITHPHAMLGMSEPYTIIAWLCNHARLSVWWTAGGHLFTNGKKKSIYKTLQYIPKPLNALGNCKYMCIHVCTY